MKIFILFWMVVVMSLINIHAHPPLDRGTAELIKAGILITTPQPNFNDGTWYYSKWHGRVIKKDHSFYSSTTQINSLTSTQFPVTSSYLEIVSSPNKIEHESNHSINANINNPTSAENEIRTYNFFDVVIIVVVTIAVCIMLFCICILCYIYFKAKRIPNNMAPISSDIYMNQFHTSSALRHYSFGDDTIVFHESELPKRSIPKITTNFKQPKTYIHKKLDGSKGLEQPKTCIQKKLDGSKGLESTLSKSTSLTESTHCYFSIERKTNYETKERSEQSKVSTKCDGSLKSFQELNNKNDTKFPQLTQAEIILARGEGAFNLNLTNFQTLEDLAGRKICKHHLEELNLRWDQKEFKHIISRQQSRKDRTVLRVCSMPNGYGVEHRLISDRPSRTHHRVTFEEAKYFLQKYGMLIHIGTPACENHHNLLKTIVAEMDASKQKNDGIEDIEDIDIVSQPRIAKDKAISRIHEFYNDISPSESNESGLTEAENAQKKIENDKACRVFADSVGIQLTGHGKGFDEIKPKTRAKKAVLLRKLTFVHAEHLAPENPLALIDLAFTNKRKELILKRQKAIDILLQYVKAQYIVCGTSDEGIEVLSQIAAVVNYETLSTVVSGITHYSYLKARLIAKMRIEAPLGPKQKRIKVKYDQFSINLFVEFITSSAIMVGLPYGTRTAKLPSGEKFDIPNTIRRQQDAEILKMFRHYLIETGRDYIKISDSVLRKILKVCSASRLKSMHCVDYYEAAGNKAFEKIESCLNSMADHDYISSDAEKYLIANLFEANRYLKTDYPLHLKMHSRIPDHCISYALSDPNEPDFCSPPCESLDNDAHNHDYNCERCQIFPDLIKDINEILQEYEPTEELEEFEAEIIKAEADIQEWKKHILRAAFSELQRVEIIYKLDENEALITIDYSQKYLGEKHMESQKDYYGKKGMSWHICHIFAKKNGKLVQHAIVHCLGFEDQTAKAVAAILRDAFEKCKSWGVNAAILRSDNACYYRNAALIQSLLDISKNCGIVLKRYSFSEVQAGKSAADREGGRMKRKMKDFIHAGKDIETPEEMVKGIRYGQEPLSGISVIVASIKSPPNEKDNAFSIPGISLLSDFEYNFNNKSITYWKHHGIGKGKTIKISISNVLDTKLDIKMATEESPESEGYEFWRTKNSLTKKAAKSNQTNTIREGEIDDDDEINVHEIINTEESLPIFKPTALFSCPTPNCQKRYFKFGNLLNHIDAGKHQLLPEKVGTYDYALNLYGNQLEDLQKRQANHRVIEAIQESITDQNNVVEKGWALRTTAKKTRFSSDVHKFVKEQIKYCNSIGKRLDPIKCEKIMELARINGKLRFTPNERLSSNQISSLVLRKMKKAGMRGNAFVFDETVSKEREDINNDLENETGEMEIEFEDDPLFPDVFEKVQRKIMKKKKEFDEEEDEEEENIEQPKKKKNRK